jgi:hypothetical protein
VSQLLIKDFEHSLALGRRDHGEADALMDTAACRHLAAAARKRLEDRVAQESGRGSAAKGT